MDKNVEKDRKFDKNLYVEEKRKFVRETFSKLSDTIDPIELLTIIITLLDTWKNFLKNRPPGTGWKKEYDTSFFYIQLLINTLFQNDTNVNTYILQCRNFFKDIFCYDDQDVWRTLQVTDVCQRCIFEYIFFLINRDSNKNIGWEFLKKFIDEDSIESEMLKRFWIFIREINGGCRDYCTFGYNCTNEDCIKNVSDEWLPIAPEKTLEKN